MVLVLAMLICLIYLDDWVGVCRVLRNVCVLVGFAFVISSCALSDCTKPHIGCRLLDA